MKIPPDGKREPNDREGALQRILDAAIRAGGVIVDDIDGEWIWDRISYTCDYWLAHAIMFGDRRWHAESAKRKKRVIKALHVILEEDPWTKFADAAREYLEYFKSSKPEEDEVEEFASPGPLLARLVGRLAVIYAIGFKTPPSYTTSPDGETDGPFIRFAEQALSEFGITRDGNQPYQRRSIADALVTFKKIPPASRDLGAPYGTFKF
jgi:hypothetical protein